MALHVIARQFLKRPVKAGVTRYTSSQSSFIGLKAIALFSDGSGFGVNSNEELVMVKQTAGENGPGYSYEPPLLNERVESAEMGHEFPTIKRVVDCDMWIEKAPNDPKDRGNKPWMKPMAPRFGAATFSTWVSGRCYHSSSWLRPVHKTTSVGHASFSSLAGDGCKSKTVNFPMSLVIFDKDGTLIDCNSVWIPWMEAHVKELEKMSGMILSDKLYYAVGYCPKEKEYQENGLLAHATVADIKEKFKDVLVENGMAYTEASEMVDKCCPQFDSGDEDTLTPLGDLTKIFETLRTNGVKTAVCTMDSRDGTMSALDRLGLTSLVDMIMCGDDRTSKPKPAPDNALHICKQLNVCPTETVVIGDTTADTGMGKSAGLGLTVGVLSGAGSRGALERESDIILNSVDEFLSVVYNDDVDGTS